MISINRTSSVTFEIAAYIKSLRTSTTDVSHFLFDTTRKVEAVGSNCKLLVAYESGVIIGILVYKAITINGRSYVNIVMADGNETALTELMIVFMDLTVNKPNDVVGVNTNLISTDASIVPHLAKQGFKRTVAVYSTLVDSLQSRLPPEPPPTYTLFRPESKQPDRKVFTDLLLDYDIRSAEYKNASIGRYVHKTTLRNNRTQSIRISYFIDSVLKSGNWRVYLLYKTKTPIGFIKWRFDRKASGFGKDQYLNGICSPDLFIKAEYFDEYAGSALRLFVDELSTTPNAKYVYDTADISDKMKLAACNRWYGKALGYSYFL